ncbi:secreted protein, partial [Streptomyces clavuligerus]
MRVRRFPPDDFGAGAPVCPAVPRACGRAPVCALCAGEGCGRFHGYRVGRPAVYGNQRAGGRRRLQSPWVTARSGRRTAPPGLLDADPGLSGSVLPPEVARSSVLPGLCPRLAGSRLSVLRIKSRPTPVRRTGVRRTPLSVGSQVPVPVRTFTFRTCYPWRHRAPPSWQHGPERPDAPLPARVRERPGGPGEDRAAPRPPDGRSCPQPVEAPMRWLVGWSGIAADFPTAAAFTDPGTAPAGYIGDADEGRTVQPVGSQLLWGDPDPLWAVGDWRPDEVRVVGLDPAPLPGQFPGSAAPQHGLATGWTRMAVLGCCAASDDELRAGLVTARGGALRHLTSWPGSYLVVVQTAGGTPGQTRGRTTVLGDLAGARPVFHTPWQGGTAYATAALPLADLVEAQLDIGHLAALLACPETPEALGDSTPYEGVRRVPPGHALILREGSREITGYEPVASLAVAGPRIEADRAVDGIRDALLDAVRARLTAPRHAPHALPPDPGPVPGMGPADRRARRGAPAPGIGADLSGGSASGTLALLAAGLPGRPGTVMGHGTGAGERLLAVTYNDLTDEGRAAELERARAIADDPRLHHVVVAAGDEGLPYAGLANAPLTDEPAPSLVLAERHRGRLAAGSADHFSGAGARQVLDAHPGRLADLLLDRRRRHLLRPVA